MSAQITRTSDCDGCAPVLSGVVNGDSAFTSYDVLEAARVYVGLVFCCSLCSWQQQQLDPMLYSSTIFNDAAFIS